jgi:hypothetical protein
VKHSHKTILASFTLQAICLSASAQGAIQLMGNKKIALAETHFTIRPINCNVADCEPKKKIMLKDICMMARRMSGVATFWGGFIEVPISKHYLLSV